MSYGSSCFFLSFGRKNRELVSRSGFHLLRRSRRRSICLHLPHRIYIMIKTFLGDFYASQLQHPYIFCLLLFCKTSIASFLSSVSARMEIRLFRCSGSVDFLCDTKYCARSAQEKVKPVPASVTLCTKLCCSAIPVQHPEAEDDFINMTMIA